MDFRAKFYELPEQPSYLIYKCAQYDPSCVQALKHHSFIHSYSYLKHVLDKKLFTLYQIISTFHNAEGEIFCKQSENKTKMFLTSIFCFSRNVLGLSATSNSLSANLCFQSGQV